MTEKQNSNQSQFYGRRLGRPLNESRQKALEDVYPLLQITDKSLTEDHRLLPQSLFSRDYKTYHLEIGFGDGKRLAEDMARNPDIGFMGCEPFINGMTSFLKTVHPCENNNARVLMDDALRLVRSLAPSSIDKLYILNPDPWHKKRHHKRRIVNPENLDLFAKIIRPGGTLILSSDVPYLNDWMMIHAYNHEAFQWNAQTCKDWQNPPKNWITTTYETKGAKGAHKMCYMVFDRK